MNIKKNRMKSLRLYSGIQFEKIQPYGQDTVNKGLLEHNHSFIPHACSLYATSELSTCDRGLQI